MDEAQSAKHTRQLWPSDFDYELPDELVAVAPAPTRTASRLLVCGRAGPYRVVPFSALPEWLAPGDLLVFNDTRVLPCRLRAHKAETGGSVEVFVLGPHQAGSVVALVRASRGLRVGQALELRGTSVVLVATESLGDGAWVLGLDPADTDLRQLMAESGEMPLPPYIAKRRRDLGMDAHSADDAQRYQTVFAAHDGAVAAPTAGLHFDEVLLSQIESAGVDRAFVTLHVGAGTFRPLDEAQPLSTQELHAEQCIVPPSTAEAIHRCRTQDGRVIAVGTTAARTLEAWAARGRRPGDSFETSIFITPGYRWQATDGLVTNFHLPRSSLLAMVSALLGMEETRRAYDRAIAERMRFYSYGDAMLILPDARWQRDVP